MKACSSISCVPQGWLVKSNQLRKGCTHAHKWSYLGRPCSSIITAQASAHNKSPTLVTRNKSAERQAYLLAALASTIGITAMAAGAVYYRLAWQMQGEEIPVVEETLGTFALAVGGTVGMERWARWAHKALWHNSLWSMHESHHRSREGQFELNDVFAIINCVPAMSLLAYGFFNQGLLSSLSFGGGRRLEPSLQKLKIKSSMANHLSYGLGITVYGMAYMFVHDGLVHKRFPVGPIANVPYLQKVAAAHQLHHAHKFDGIPYGLFLGPKELEEVGGLEELERVMKSRSKQLSEEPDKVI